MKNTKGKLTRFPPALQPFGLQDGIPSLFKDGVEDTVVNCRAVRVTNTTGDGTALTLDV